MAGLAVAARAFDLAVLRGEDLSARAERQQRRTLRLAGYRGRILDRTGQPLAVTVDLESAFATPGEVEDARSTARRLARLLGGSTPEILARLESDRSFVWIDRGLSPREAGRLRALGLKGVGLVTEPHRFYPNRELAAHVLGFAGEDRGLEGIELSADRTLSAPDRAVLVECDARGVPLISEMGGAAPARGGDVVLTLDHRIQMTVERALARGVATTAARGGTAVVLDPFTGEILALAVAPPFNPNRFSEVDPARWRDRAVTDAFEPGSTLKVFVVAGALEEGRVRPSDVFDGEGGVLASGVEPIHDWKPFGRLTLAEVLKFSSNIGAVKIGQRLGRKGLESVLRNFGFGAETGADLPGEVAGMLPPSRSWPARTADTIAFGQGMAVTALQLVSAFAAVANGGVLLKPHVVLEARDPLGRVVERNDPEPLRRVISPATSRRMAEFLRGVVAPGGTGERAAVPGYDVAGKTGTAQKALPGGAGYSRERQVASFLGFVPVDRPRLAVLVVIDEPQRDQGGGAAAAPVFREIAGDALVSLGVPPSHLAPPAAAAVDPPSSSPRPSPPPSEAVLLGPNRVPDFKGLTLREVLRAAAQARLRIRVDAAPPAPGTPEGLLGRVASQDPPAGGADPAGGVVLVQFSPGGTPP